ncbi:MAG TPA: ankyrin repeat domain-containing protein [Pyrinomonadaceae bacterium]
MNVPAILQAAATGHTAVVQSLLAEGVDINEKGRNGDTALMRAAANGQLETVQLLLDEGADINAQRGDGMTALILAAFFGHLDVVLALINKGANLSARDRTGMTALDRARSKGETDTVNILTSTRTIDAQTSVNERGAGRPITSKVTEELLSQSSRADSDGSVDDILDLPSAPGLLTSDTQRDTPLQLEGDLLSPEPPRDLSQSELTEPPGVSRVPPVEPRTALSQHAGRVVDALRESDPAGEGGLADDNFNVPETVSPISSPEGLQTGLHAHSKRVLKNGIPAATFGPVNETPLQSKPVSSLKYASLFLAIMFGSAALTWTIVLRMGGFPNSYEAPSILPSQGEGAANRIGGAGTGTPTKGESPQKGARASSDDAVLTAALGDWVAATNAKDIEKQMSFYAPRLDTFYRLRNVSSSIVRDEKINFFARAREVHISTSEPEIRYSRNALRASMRFRKVYLIDIGLEVLRGEIIQELVWRKTKNGWKVVGERDVKVIR